MANLTLAGRDYELRPLTLGQLRLLLDAIAALGGKSGGALVEAAAEIIAAGLSRDHPELTAEAVLALEIGLDEANRAVAAILRAAGLSPAGAGAGEGLPVASAEPGSPASTAPSPPAASIPIPSSTG
jgi:hypothetical protein